MDSSPAVHSITDATQAHSDDMDVRVRRYLLQMGFRVVCLILVIVVHSPVRWVFGVLAVILPYIAVVMANAAGGRRGAGPKPVPIARIPLPGPVLDDGAEKPGAAQSSPEESTEYSHERSA